MYMYVVGDLVTYATIALNIIFQNGETWIYDTCSTICSCIESQVQCDSYQCHEDAECKVMNGVRECVCDPGFTGDGLNCVTGKIKM